MQPNWYLLLERNSPVNAYQVYLKLFIAIDAALQ